MKRFLPIILQVVGVLLAAISGGSFANLQQPGVDTEIWKYLVTALMGGAGVSAAGGAQWLQSRQSRNAPLPDAASTTVTLFDQALHSRDPDLLTKAHEAGQHLIQKSEQSPEVTAK